MAQNLVLAVALLILTILSQYYSCKGLFEAIPLNIFIRDVFIILILLSHNPYPHVDYLSQFLSSLLLFTSAFILYYSNFIIIRANEICASFVGPKSFLKL